MAINLHGFDTAAAFESFRWDFIKRAEGVRTSPYVDHVGAPTIGVGFNLTVENIRNGVFDALGWRIDDDRIAVATDQAISNAFIHQLENAVSHRYTAGDNDSLRNAINAILAQRAQALAAYGFIASQTTMVLPEAQMPAIFLLAVPRYQERVRTALGLNASAWPDTSREMVALTSMAYQGTLSRISAKVKQAIADGDRAEVWYLIRYTAQVTGPGDYGRHYSEAQTFGLYDGENTGTKTSGLEESQRIFQMLTRHHKDIIDYEAAHGGVAVADAVSRFGLNAADVQLVDDLVPARDTFITWLNTQLPADNQINALIINPVSVYYNGNNSASSCAVLDATGDDGKGAGLEQNVMVGNIGVDIITGGAGEDVLVGLAGNDILDGGTDDDELYGGLGNDTLDGGTGNDTYVFKSDEGNDKILDSDGVGRIMVAGEQLTGATKHGLDGLKQFWTSDDGKLTYTYQPGGSGSTTGTLTITGDALGSGEIVLDKFDLAKAASGVLGLSLGRKTALEIATGNSTPFAEAGYEAQNQTSDLNEGQARALRCFLNGPALAGDIIKFSLAGGDSSRFALCIGDDTISFADGEVTLELQEGQTEIAFAFINTGDVDTDAALKLTATYQPLAGDSASNTLTINFDATEEPDDQPPSTDRDIVGDYAPTDFYDAEGHLYHQPDDLGNLITDPDKPGARDDTLYDSAGNDHIVAGDGDDSIRATRGGDDLIETGAGEAGDDSIFADAAATLDAALALNKTQPGSGEKGDWLDGGDGRDLAVGNDVLAVGGRPISGDSHRYPYASNDAQRKHSA